MQDYDAHFDAWLDQVKKILNKPDLQLEDVECYDPFGCHDDNLTPEEFVKEMEVQKCKM